MVGQKIKIYLIFQGDIPKIIFIFVFMKVTYEIAKYKQVFIRVSQAVSQLNFSVLSALQMQAPVVGCQSNGIIPWLHLQPQKNLEPILKEHFLHFCKVCYHIYPSYPGHLNLMSNHHPKILDDCLEIGHRHLIHFIYEKNIYHLKL